MSSALAILYALFPNCAVLFFIKCLETHNLKLCSEYTTALLLKSRNGLSVSFSKVGRPYLSGYGLKSFMAPHLDLNISVKETTVFSVFHPDAHDLFNSCSDLKKVVWELWDPERRLNDQVPLFCF